MKISVIVTFYKGINILKTCLANFIKTLPEQGSDIITEILVINDNPDISLGEIEQSYKESLDLRVINMPYNRGYSACCNLGVASAKYETILLMDCDIMPCGKWLLNMIKTYNDIDKKGSVSASILNMTTNTLVSYGVCIYGVDIILLKRNSPRNDFTSYDRDFPIVTSGCLLISKELYQSLGGQEELMVNAYNDFDLTYKIFLKGFKNRMSSQSIVYHRGSVSGSIRHLPFKADAKAFLFQRWGKKLQKTTSALLKDIYGFYKGIKYTNIITVNFSNSLSAHYYINLFCDIHHLNILQEYTIKNIALDDIIINDCLSWEVCRTDIPILYFVDEYTLISNNYYWFINRKNTNDIILDLHTNIFPANHFFKS